MMIHENECLHLKNQDIQDELQKVVFECREYLALRQGMT